VSRSRVATKGDESLGAGMIACATASLRCNPPNAERERSNAPRSAGVANRRNAEGCGVGRRGSCPSTRVFARGAIGQAAWARGVLGLRVGVWVFGFGGRARKRLTARSGVL
jgi:hypothetical protein